MWTAGRAWALSGLLFTAIFVADFCLNLIGIGFPITWHPDELGKAIQIQSWSFNFYHPQLLLRLTDVARFFYQPDDTTRTLVLTGRLVSAAATAAAVSVFGIIVARRFGILPGLTAAVLVGITPTVFVNAHFFKEDSTLLLGCALVLLALQSVELNPSKRNTIMLGIAVGVACSAKYIGALLLIPSLLVVGKEQRFVVCAGAAITFAIINVAAFFGPLAFVKGVVFEINHVTSSHGGVQFGPSSYATGRFLLSSTALIFVLVWLSGLVWVSWNALSTWSGSNGNQVPRYEVAIYLTPLLFMGAIQLSRAVLPRYLVSVSAMVTLAALWTLARFVADGKVKIARPAAALLLCIGAAVTINSFTASASIFLDPPRLKLAKWISDNLPPSAKIAADFYSGIPNANRAKLDPTLLRLPQQVEIIFPVPVDDGLSIEGLRLAGFTHIVTSGGNYDRLFDPAGKIVWPVAEKRKRYYKEVFQTLRLLHEEPAGTDLDDLFASRMAIYDIQK
jgi:hypothetical protein